jgi:signal transduction histidine kinase
MPPKAKRQIRCLLISPIASGDELEQVKVVLRSAAKEVGAQVHQLENTLSYRTEFSPRAIFSELTKADLIIALPSNMTPSVYYEMGIAQALGKPTILIAKPSETPHLMGIPTVNLVYEDSNLIKLSTEFKRLIERFRRTPNRFSTPGMALASTLPVIDLERLESREFENLCFELLSQMGYRRMEWGKELQEVDVVATLPKKDPDGFEYHELWLIALGRNVPTEMMLDVIERNPDYFIERLLRRWTHEDVALSSLVRSPITALIIAPPQFTSQEMVENQIRLSERRLMTRPGSNSLRIRVWDQQYLIGLIQQYPQIAYKYFSDEGRAQSKYRKTPDEFYRETVELNERLQATNVALTEEREKRLKAERDAVWKDVAFKAAHKLGNPVFALETDLQSLKRRIMQEPEEAMLVAQEMGVSIEKAKGIIEQFKSLVRAQESVPQRVELLPLLESAARIARENAVEVSINSVISQPAVIVDPARITECLDELFANSLHWLDKDEKTINITIDIPTKKELPPDVDSSRKYLRICFQDNGSGVPADKKQKIFSPFFTTNPHGTGLGLSMIQKVIEAHGGVIRENGNYGEGARVEIFLPQTKLTEVKNA